MSKIKYNADQVKSVFDANPSENSIIITSDGNVFFVKHKHYAKTHCTEFKAEFQELTREQFNNENKGGKSTTPGSAAPSSTDWKEGKFKDIIEFAKSKGLEATTKSNKGTKALIEEVEAYLVTLESADKKPKDEGAEGAAEGGAEGEGAEGDDYTPVGSTEGNPAAE